MKTIYRTAAVTLLAVTALVLAACGISQQPQSGVVADVGGSDNYYSIQIGDTIYSCYAPRNPTCGLLKKGDTITYNVYQDRIEYVTRTAKAEQ